MSDAPPDQRRLTPDERARMRAGLFAEIDREQRPPAPPPPRAGRRRHARPRVAALAVVALRTPDAPTTDTARSMPVRCTAGDQSVPGGVTVASTRHDDPRLVCSELWRRGELVGGRAQVRRRSAPAPAPDAREVLVLVYASDDALPPLPAAATSQQ